MARLTNEFVERSVGVANRHEKAYRSHRTSGGHERSRRRRAPSRAGASMKLTVQEAAKFLEQPESSVYRWIKEGSLPAHKANERYWLNRAELLEWATSRG